MTLDLTPIVIKTIQNEINWSADNLEYVTPEENRKRTRLLRVLRSVGREPKQMNREEFLKHEISNIRVNHFLRWYYQEAVRRKKYDFLQKFPPEKEHIVHF